MTDIETQIASAIDASNGGVIESASMQDADKLLDAVINSANQTLFILRPSIDDPVFSKPNIFNKLRKACNDRNVQVRVLVGDAGDPIILDTMMMDIEGHAIVREMPESLFESLPFTFVVADQASFHLRPDRFLPESKTAFGAPARSEKYIENFMLLWRSSEQKYPEMD